MALEMTAGHGCVRGVQPLDLREPGPSGPQVGGLKGAGLVVMEKITHFPTVYSAAGSGSTRPEPSSSSLGVAAGARTRRMSKTARGSTVKSTASNQKSSA
jgi:hypothetical protein